MAIQPTPSAVASSRTCRACAGRRWWIAERYDDRRRASSRAMRRAGHHRADVAGNADAVRGSLVAPPRDARSRVRPRGYVALFGYDTRPGTMSSRAAEAGALRPPRSRAAAGVMQIGRELRGRLRAERGPRQHRARESGTVRSGQAWATALATPSAGHAPFVVVMQPGLPVVAVHAVRQQGSHRGR